MPNFGNVLCEVIVRLHLRTSRGEINSTRKTIAQLRGLTITGLGGAANNGINFTQDAQLIVSDCEISGFNFTSIWAGASNSVVDVKNTVMRNGSDGFYSVGSVRVSLDGVHVAHNSSRGVVANSGAAVTIANSVLADNQAVGIQVSAFGG